MVEEVPQVAFLIDKPALVEIPIDRLQNRDAASGLVDGEPLGRREFE